MEIKKLITRGLSGSIYVLLIVGCVLWGDVGISLLGIIFAILATIELERITLHDPITPLPLIWLDVAGTVLLAISFNHTMPFTPLIFWVIIVLARFVAELFAKNSNPVKSLAISMFAQVYIGLPLAAMSLTAFLVVPKTILLVFLFLWINDTGAFIVGSMIGKHKLTERISPKKTWEGFFGGLIFNLITSVLLCYCSSIYMGLHSNIFHWLVLALIVTLFGTWGDLVESLIKRHLKIKDSGNLIPGHGGILDRIDSFLLAMPAVLVFFAFLELF